MIQVIIMFTNFKVSISIGVMIIRIHDEKSSHTIKQTNIHSHRVLRLKAANKITNLISCYILFRLPD